MVAATIACPQCHRTIGGDDSVCAHCGADVSRVLLLKTLRGETLGEYEILGELGTGGMASVFLAHDIALNRKVALKVMLPALLQGRDTLERFKREAQTAAALSHPHIIPIYAVKQGKKLLYIAMKCVEGRTLGSIIDEVHQLPVGMVQAIIAQVGGALGYAHRQGVVHRDMKPDNIMIDNEGWAVVTDFGIAKVTEATNLTATGAAIGTPAYMSPEQCSGEPVSGAADQYSLGAVAYEMLTGKPPFTSPTLMGMMWAHVNTAPPPVAESRPDCPVDLVNAVLRMLAKDPVDRFPSMEDAVGAVGIPTLTHDDPVRTSLIELAKTGDSVELIAKIRTPSSPVPSGSSDTSRSEPGTRQRAPRWWIVAAAVVVVAGTATVVALRGRGDRGGPAEVTADALPDAAVVMTGGSLELATPRRPLAVGDTEALSAVLRDDDGTVVEGEPLTWESSDPTVANVSLEGLVTGVSPGLARITARSSRHSATTVVRVGRTPVLRPPGEAGPVVASVQVMPVTRTLAVGDTARFVAVARDRAGVEMAAQVPRWDTSDESVVTMAANGIATGVRPGLAVVTATIDERSAQATVMVSPTPAARIELSAPTGPLAVGSSVRLVARVLGPDGRELAGRPVRWSSSDEAVATVTDDGVVTGVGNGGAQIVVVSGSRSTARPIVVEARPVEQEAAPDVAVGPDIEAVIREYAQALEARDIDRVKQLYPDLPAAREQAWRDIFALGELTVSMDAIEVLARQDGRATASFRQTLDGRRLERNTTSFVAELVQTPAGWRIVAIR